MGRFNLRSYLTRPNGALCTRDQLFSGQAEVIKKPPFKKTASKKTFKAKDDLIHLLGRKFNPRLVIQSPSDNDCNLTMNIIVQAKETGLDICCKKLEPSTPKGNRERKKGPQGTPYERVYTIDSSTLFKEVSPLKKQQNKNPTGLITFKKHLLLKPPIQKEDEHFAFEVRRENLGKAPPRPFAAKKATGYSAADFFRLYGAHILTREHGSNYHLGHRQGHFFWGLMEASNLDPGTAGSNYTTLFYVENPLVELFRQFPELDIVQVRGRVQYHSTLPIPVMITYTMEWELKGVPHRAEKNIYPMDYRIPTVAENTAVKLMNTYLSLSCN